MGLTRQSGLRWLAPSGVALGLLLYIRYRMDPLLIYHVQQPEYFQDTSWLDHSLAVPGGAADLVGRYTGQFLYHAWPGSLAILGVVGLVAAATAAAVRAVSGRHPGWLSLLPALVVLAAHHDYEQTLSPDFALIAALLP